VGTGDGMDGAEAAMGLGRHLKVAEDAGQMLASLLARTS